MARMEAEYDPVTNSTDVYYQYSAEAAIQEQVVILPAAGSSNITTIIGGGGGSVTGPTITIDGGVTGYDFVASGTTLDMVLSSAATARTALGLGTIAVLNSPLLAANGGTGTTTPTGVYSPTLTNVTNLDGSTAFQCQWMRVNDMVTVSGKVSVDPTAAGNTQLGISLPIASNIGAQEDCAGAAFASGIAGQGAAIIGDAANNRAEMVWIAVDTTNQPMYFQFMYQVI